MSQEQSRRVSPWMSLPGNSEELRKMFQSGIRHPAMKMANIALNMKRSPKQVFILLVGLSGAGKSSTVNYLFETKIAPTSETKSETRSTIEYKVQLKSEEWLIPDLTLSIIDTPGFGDTDGFEQDSKNIMSIKYFLEKHPHINKAFPNLVFVVLNIQDNRIEGESSQFAKMLKGISHVNAIDHNNPNVVVILTHAAAIARKREKWIEMVSRKKEEVKAIVEVHLGITPEVVVQENHPDDNELDKDGDWDILPNGEKQPKALFQACKRILNTSKDEIGHEAVAVCFRPGQGKDVAPGSVVHSENVNQADVQYMRDILLQSVVMVAKSEVGKMLDDYKKTGNVTALYNDIILLQVKLRDMNICTVQDIQRLTMNTLVSKMFPVRINGRMEKVLEDVFGLKYEQMSALDFPIGCGYNIFSDTKSHMSPIVMTGRGNKFGLPDNVDLRECMKYTVNCQAVKTTQNFIDERLKDLNINLGVKLKYDAFNMKMLGGYNLTESSTASQTQHSNKWSFAIEQQMYKISIQQPYVINPQLANDIKNLPNSVNLEDEEEVNKLKIFFDKWGYYAITGSYLGGSLSGHVITEGHTSAEEACEDAQLALAFQLKYLQSNVEFDADKTNSYKVQKDSTAQLRSTSIQWNGGDRGAYKNSLESIGVDEWNRWVKSLEHSPAALWKSLEIYPMYLLVEDISKEKGMMIQKATNLALTGEFTFKPKKEDNRENTGESNESGGCFHGESTIILHDGTIKCIQDVCPGDLVLTIDENGIVSKDVIITWIHKVQKGQFKFLKITHNQGTIRTTPEHIMFVGSNNTARHASSVIPGEELHFFKPEGNNKFSTLVTVLSVEEVTGTGIYAPLTFNGRLLVDGVAASCYCTLRPIQALGKTLVSAHSLAHFGFLPIRLAYIFGIDVKNKIDRKTGIHLYAKWLKEKLLQYLP